MTGLPQGQEKSGKTKKKYKSQEKMGVYEKSREKSGNLTKFKIKSDFVSLVLQSSLFSKAISRNLITSPLKSD